MEIWVCKINEKIYLEIFEINKSIYYLVHNLNKSINWPLHQRNQNDGQDTQNWTWEILRAYVKLGFHWNSTWMRWRLKHMTDKTSLYENCAPHTCKEKGMGMKEWWKEGLGLISQSSEVHHSEVYAHIESTN